MTKLHSRSKHVSLIRLPVSYNLLSPKIAQVDGAFEKLPHVGSSAWKEIRIRAVHVLTLEAGQLINFFSGRSTNKDDLYDR